MRAAASSSASGIPSSRRQIAATIPAFTASSSNAGATARAQLINNRTAGAAAISSGHRSSPTAGTANGIAGNRRSARNRGAARLVARDRQARARFDIRGLPMGMYTYVPEGGATFSGGQRQRLMIARALVRRPRLLFFDEATSALDNATQEIVTACLNALGASRLVIAHRLSTVQHADRIVVLSGGKVVQTGRYEELAKQEGVFAQLVRPQIA
ncbi:MAG: ATP-binding cassette domain-containing protein [Chloroflexi bacterium]|nr:ATP-binding cassette domain-containing protein [Chloroflexota bacterium]